MVQSLRNLGQNLTLSPSELVTSALEFKVTNQLLCELEGALSFRSQTGDGRPDALPRCFRERDLDSGRTRWRIIVPPAPEPGPQTAAKETVPSQKSALLKARSAPVSTSRSPRSNEPKATFLEDALPAPRIPGDPNFPATLHPPSDPDDVDQHSAAGEERSSPALRQRLQRSLLRPLRGHRHRRRGDPAGTPAGVEEAPTPPARPSHRTEERRPSGRSSSVPSSLSRPVERSQTEVSDSGQSWQRLEDIPARLQPFALRDLDTGEWTLIDDVCDNEPVAAGDPVATGAVASAPRSPRGRRRLWPGKFRNRRENSHRKQGFTVEPHATPDVKHNATPDILLEIIAEAATSAQRASSDEYALETGARAGGVGSCSRV